MSGNGEFCTAQSPRSGGVMAPGPAGSAPATPRQRGGRHPLRGELAAAVGETDFRPAALAFVLEVIGALITVVTGWLGGGPDELTADRSRARSRAEITGLAGPATTVDT